MPDLEVGQALTVDGPRGGQHRIHRASQDIYICSCMERSRWVRHLRNVPEQARTCRHLLFHRGFAVEAQRLRSHNITGHQLNSLMITLPPVTALTLWNWYFSDRLEADAPGIVEAPPEPRVDGWKRLLSEGPLDMV